MILSRLLRMVAALTVAWVSGGCSGKAVTSEAAGPPPIPLRTGPLTIDVVYPRDSAFISSRDSSFIFGSVGNGNAELTINGQAVTVEQNGAFLAWLQVPATPGDTLAHYDLRASLAGQQIRAVRTVRLRATDAPLPDDVMEIDTASIAPSGAWWARSGEIVPIRVRASPATRVRLLLPGGELIRLSEAPESQGSGIYEGELVVESPLGRGLLSPRLQPIPAALRGAVYCEVPALFEIDEAVADTSVDFLAPTGSRDTDEHVADSASAATIIAIPSECAVLEVASTTDTLRAPLPFDLWVLDGPGPAVELRETPSAVGRDGFVIGRAAPGGTTLWMWIEGVSALTAEEAARIAADATEHQHHLDGDAAEAAARQAADAQLASDLADEEAARIAADVTEHQHHLDGDAAEAAARQAADATLQGNIDDEAAARSAADAAEQAARVADSSYWTALQLEAFASMQCTFAECQPA